MELLPLANPFRQGGHASHGSNTDSCLFSRHLAAPRQVEPQTHESRMLLTKKGIACRNGWPDGCFYSWRRSTNTL